VNALDATAGDLAERLGAELVGPATLRLERIDAIDRAGPADLTFIRDQRFAGRWADAEAGAAVVTRGIEVEGHDASRRALLIVDDADRAMITLLQEADTGRARPDAGVHPAATVDPSATVAPSARVGPGASVGPGSVVEADATLCAGAAVGAGVRIGAGAELRPGVVVEDRCVIGAGVIIHPNTVIGADGFGYRPSEDGRSIVKIPHIGWVEVHDHVEIGACSSVDRGKFGPTVIGAGTKIDNQVQIGHNCRIGRGCVICGAVGIAGSVVIGDGVTIGGGAGIRDNVRVGDGATLAAGVGLMHDVPAGETWLGAPARRHDEAMRDFAAARDLAVTLREIRKRIKALERAGADAAAPSPAPPQSSPS
jgi:UDP-3-O-[3-hydroxymyristoyl] glucosamine N-acyltransferase